MRIWSPLAAAALLSCNIVEPVCACSPPVFRAIVRGGVDDPSAMALPNARVLAQGAAKPCSKSSTSGNSFVRVETVADQAGSYRLEIESGATGSGCFLLWAEPPSGSNLAPSDTHALLLDFAWPPDTTLLPLRLRPAN